MKSVETSGRWLRIGPILAGALLDVTDLATFGPIGLSGGFLLGAGVGWWVAGELGHRGRKRMWMSAAAAAYTATPFTEALPLGTLAGTLVRLSGGGAAGDEIEVAATEVDAHRNESAKPKGDPR